MLIMVKKNLLKVWCQLKLVQVNKTMIVKTVEVSPIPGAVGQVRNCLMLDISH